MSRVLRCHPGIGPKVEGEALVASDNFSARYDLDRIKGVFSRPAHKLFGECYRDKILVLNTAKGGVASAWMLREMLQSGVTPKALVFNTVNTILAQGAAFAGLTMVDRFDCADVTQEINSGDLIEVDPVEGYVRISTRSR
ncbi:MAG: hypothetical protein DI565_07740 [Ancylobacter novellus]|uniref:Phosphomevalonate dehydratase small subunit-like domain-containing protein n=1 Tax=Ancylobacter novellus TaxID=921 RepID=A0A2W5KJG6_ANCNO|nr:MAG: hypothetical protein DI565_07740 [Ancylobacter novellus]